MLSASDMAGRVVSGQRVEVRLDGTWLITEWPYGRRETKVEPETIRKSQHTAESAHSGRREVKTVLPSSECLNRTDGPCGSILAHSGACKGK